MSSIWYGPLFLVGPAHIRYLSNLMTAPIPPHSVANLSTMMNVIQSPSGALLVASTSFPATYIAVQLRGGTPALPPRPSVPRSLGSPNDDHCLVYGVLRNDIPIVCLP